MTRVEGGSWGQDVRTRCFGSTIDDRWKSPPPPPRSASLSFYKLSVDLFLGRHLTILAECGRLEGGEEIIDVQKRRQWMWGTNVKGWSSECVCEESGSGGGGGVGGCLWNDREQNDVTGNPTQWRTTPPRFPRWWGAIRVVVVGGWLSGQTSPTHTVHRAPLWSTQSHFSLRESSAVDQSQRKKKKKKKIKSGLVPSPSVLTLTSCCF